MRGILKGVVEGLFDCGGSTVRLPWNEPQQRNYGLEVYERRPYRSASQRCSNIRSNISHRHDTPHAAIQGVACSQTSPKTRQNSLLRPPNGTTRIGPVIVDRAVASQEETWDKPQLVPVTKVCISHPGSGP